MKKTDNISVMDKYFLGGPLTLRGFKNRGAGPHLDDCSLGNDAYWLAGVHLYTPLPFLHKNKKLNWLKTHSFANIGSIFSHDQISKQKKINFTFFILIFFIEEIINDQNVDVLVNNVRLSVGTGIVIGFGNIARLELNYVWPLWKLSEDK